MEWHRVCKAPERTCDVVWKEVGKLEAPSSFLQTHRKLWAGSWCPPGFSKINNRAWVLHVTESLPVSYSLEAFMPQQSGCLHNLALPACISGYSLLPCVVETSFLRTLQCLALSKSRVKSCLWGWFQGPWDPGAGRRCLVMSVTWAGRVWESWWAGGQGPALGEEFVLWHPNAWMAVSSGDWRTWAPWTCWGWSILGKTRNPSEGICTWRQLVN